VVRCVYVVKKSYTIISMAPSPD